MATSINRPPRLGSPFATRGVTSMDTQTSDAVEITGGTIEGVQIGLQYLTTGGPLSVDGFIAADGAITSGTTAFSSASAAFSAITDIGKPISIRKAGAKFFMDSATISNGGTGHAVGDLVNFDNDIQVFVLTVSGGAVTKFYIVNKGSASTNSATISQKVNNPPTTYGSIQGGSTLDSIVTGGSGLVLTPTWVRENLVTTIANVTSPTAVVLATAASATVSSATWGYGTDYSEEIQAALDAGLPVRVPPGIVGCASALTLGTSDVLLGQARNSGNTVGTTLLWLGAANQPQIVLGTQAGDRQSYLEFGGLTLNGLGAASKGIYARGISSSKVHPTFFLGHTTVGLDVHGNDNEIDSIDNNFEQLTLNYSDNWDLNTVGIWWGFPNTFDIACDHDLSRYGQVQIKAKSTIPGAILGAVDHNIIDKFQVRGGGSGGDYTPPGIEMLGSRWATNGHCRDNTWLNMDAGQGGLVVRATGYDNLPNNIVDVYDRANGAPAWSVESGGELTARNGNGHSDQLRIIGQTYASLQLPNNPAALAFVNDSATNSQGELVTGGGSFNVIAAYTGSGSDWRVAFSLQEKTTTVNTKNKTADYTVLAVDSGAHFFNSAAVGQIIYTLPAPVAGLNYAFTAAAAGQNIRILATSGATVCIGTAESAANGYAESNAPLSTIEIVSPGPNRWVAKSSTGTWTVS